MTPSKSFDRWLTQSILPKKKFKVKEFACQLTMTQLNKKPVYSNTCFRQESLLTLVDAHRHVDLLHSMSYDQGGAQHSPRYLHFEK